MLNDVPIAELIPELRDWNAGDGIDLRSWLTCVGSFQHAIAYGDLFWPKFAEFDGCVFFCGFSEESYQRFMRQTNGNKQAVETVMNHRHILDLFSNSDLKPSLKQVVYLGRLLQEVWAAKLSRDFPAKQFVVSFPDHSSDDLLEYEITFFQEAVVNVPKACA